MKVLFLSSRFPYPLEKGDKLRAFQQIKNLHAFGHKVHLVALSDCFVSADSVAKLRPYCVSVHVLRISLFRLFFNLAYSFIRNLPVQVGYFYSKVHHRVIAKLIDECKPDVIYCQLIRTALFVKDIHSIPKVIDYQDAFSKGTYQRMQKAPLILKPLFVREYNLVKSFELNVFNWFDAHTIISTQDKDAIEFTNSQKVAIIPNGIDVNFFRKENALHEFAITFVGNMNYPPNVDASIFLINEIMPLVWKTMPQATVQLAGANPSKAVRELASKKVKVTGWVNDIRNCYNNTTVFIAPMRIGTGLQNKLLEAMAMEVACVTTPISFEPLGAAEGVEILVGNDANELASHLIRLLSNEALRNEIALNGHNLIVKNYSMEKSGTLLDRLINEVAVMKKFT